MKLRNKKTGEIKEFGGDKFELAEYYEEYGGGIKNVYSYNSLAELNAEWEDYAPKEPLIKDENIRKAIRIWADINTIDKVTYEACNGGRLSRFVAQFGIDYWLELSYFNKNLVSGNCYTIAELCGEEE